MEGPWKARGRAVEGRGRQRQLGAPELRLEGGGVLGPIEARRAQVREGGEGAGDRVPVHRDERVNDEVARQVVAVDAVHEDDGLRRRGLDPSTSRSVAGAQAARQQSSIQSPRSVVRGRGTHCRGGVVGADEALEHLDGILDGAAPGHDAARRHRQPHVAHAGGQLLRRVVLRADTARRLGGVAAAGELDDEPDALAAAADDAVGRRPSRRPVGPRKALRRERRLRRAEPVQRRAATSTL